MDNFPLREKWIETENGKVFYYTNTPFTGRPTVVFVHGLSSNHTTWTNITKALHAQNFNSIAVDLRGHGLSDKRKTRSLYQFSVFSDDLYQILKAERVNRAVLVGYSFGGYVALDFAVRHSELVDGLILISANYVNPLVYKGIGFLTPICYGFLQLLSFLLLWQKKKRYSYYEHGKGRGYWHSVWMGLNTMPLSVNFWMLSQVGKLDFRKTVGTIQAQTLIIRAKHDPFLSRAEAEDMARAMPNAKIIVSNHKNHFLASQSQDEVSKIILDFLHDHENSNL